MPISSAPLVEGIWLVISRFPPKTLACVTYRDYWEGVARSSMVEDFVQPSPARTRSQETTPVQSLSPQQSSSVVMRRFLPRFLSVFPLKCEIPPNGNDTPAPRGGSSLSIHIPEHDACAVRCDSSDWMKLPQTFCEVLERSSIVTKLSRRAPPVSHTTNNQIAPRTLRLRPVAPN